MKFRHQSGQAVSRSLGYLDCFLEANREAEKVVGFLHPAFSLVGLNKW